MRERGGSRVVIDPIQGTRRRERVKDMDRVGGYSSRLGRRWNGGRAVDVGDVGDGAKLALPTVRTLRISKRTGTQKGDGLERGGGWCCIVGGSQG